MKTSGRTKTTSKNRARTEISFHTLASEIVLRLCVIKIKMFIFLPLPLQYFFSAEDVKSRIYPSLDAIFFSPSCFITAAWTAANSNCTFALRCLGLCCTFDLTRLFNVGNWADSLKLQTGDCTPQDANTSHLTAVSLHRLISLTSGRGNTANYETLLALSTCGLIWKLHLLFGSGGILLTMPRKHLWNILHIAAALLVISFPFIYKLELSKQLLHC